MQIFRLLTFITILFPLIESYSQETSYQPDFLPPLDIPLLLSGNFGELRSTHFHSGIDIKTQQQIGKNVYASKEGYISRIKIQSGSYGKSLYITHPDGYTTVYGHLNDYIPEIDSYITNYQYAVKKFEVDVYPKKSEFPVSKGQLIAHSGNTGYSGGPHLHFEIRDYNQSPLNVLQFKFKITDNIRPDIVNLAIYPMEPNSFINGKNKKLIIKPEKINGNYIIKDSIQISGKAGFGLETYDYLNGSGNKCTVYSIELSVNDTVYYYHQMDKFSFDEAKYINSHVDYEENILQKIKLHKLHLDPNNKLNIYRLVKNSGSVDFSEDTVFDVRIVVKDTYLNSSTLNFRVHGSAATYMHGQLSSDSAFVKTFFYNQTNEYRTPDFRIFLQPDVLFKNINFTYSAISVDSLIYSDMHFVHSDLTPVSRSYTLALKSKNLPERYRTKAVIACLDRDNKSFSMGGSWENGFVKSQVKNFGKFFLAVDTISPSIKPVGFKSNGIYKPGDIISFKITDDFSGIKSYNGYIDNQWALFEYDAKDDMLNYTPDKNSIVEGGLHTLEIVVVDERNNIAVYKSGFYY